MRTVALLGGGDWADASVDLLDIPDGIDIEKIKAEWFVWYRTDYLPNYKAGNKPQFKTVIDMLLALGAKHSDIEKVEI